MVDALAKRMGLNLRQHGVSLISVEGLNFDSFLPLFGDKALKIPVAVITDSDPQAPVIAHSNPAVPASVASLAEEPEEEVDGEPLYPAPGDAIILSANATKMKSCEDDHVKVFYGLKTFEYDLAMEADNRPAMLKALEELRPRIAKSLAVKVNREIGNAAKAKALFCGMFERKENNVQKGSFAQSLAQIISDKTVPFSVPAYIQAAIQHVCKTGATPVP